ncbi:MAG TPA: histidine kinase [Microbacterium sp.]|nr:histidine kinase [Microbacterium sp.]
MFRALRPYQLIVDVSVAAILFAVTLTSTLTPELFAPMGTANGLLAVPVAVLVCGALAIRRLSPTLALVVAWAGALLQMALGLPPLPVDVAVFGVLYVTAAYGSSATMWAGLASSFLGAGLISGYLVIVPVLRQGLSLSTLLDAALSAGVLLYVAAAFALLLAWTIGALVRMALRARANRAAQAEAEAEAAAEQERLRIARDMHDIVAHSLAVVIAQADGARYAAASDPSAAGEALGTISSTARTALADVRLLLTQLRRPHSPYPTSPAAMRGASGEREPSRGDAPQPALADLEGLYAQVRAAGVDLRVEVDPAPPVEPPGAVQLAVYRILQEALTNALRHGDGGPVSVHLAWRPDALRLEVRNDVPAGATAAGGGHGVIGMRERAHLAGGRLETEAEDGCFAVRATLPVSAGVEA